MKKYVFIIGLVAFFIALPNRVYSQQNSKKPKKELECGCEINDVDRKCGKCGGFLISHWNKYLTNNFIAFDYECRDCKTHKHTALSNEFNYGHVCNEQRCLKKTATKDSEGNRILHIRNVCPKETPFIVWILPKSRHLRSLIVPGAEWTPNVKFPKDKRIQMEIDTRSRR